FNCFMVFSTTVVFPTASTPSIIINIGSFSRLSFFSILFCVSFVIFLNINSFLFVHLPFSYHLQYFSSSVFSIFTLYSSILLNYYFFFFFFVFSFLFFFFFFYFFFFFFFFFFVFFFNFFFFFFIFFFFFFFFFDFFFFFFFLVFSTPFYILDKKSAFLFSFPGLCSILKLYCCTSINHLALFPFGCLVFKNPFNAL